MNPWDIDPHLYAPLWKLLRDWYLERKQARSRALPRPVRQPGRQAGCRA